MNQIYVVNRDMLIENTADHHPIQNPMRIHHGLSSRLRQFHLLWLSQCQCLGGQEHPTSGRHIHLAVLRQAVLLS